MTNRSRWILAVAICGMVIGVLNRLPYFAILNLTLVIWIAIEWFLFRWKVLLGSKIIAACQREVDGQTRSEFSLTLNQTYTVRLRVEFDPALNGLRLFLQDHIPQGIESNDRFPAVIDLRDQYRMDWQYSLTPKVTGRVDLPGIQITVADKFGFFRHQQFIVHRQTLTLLPFLLQPRTTAERVKSNNIQLMSGHHRYRKAGVSSELLGIREYQAGDPPRSIAWKATARTGQLMTCEYESEVPIRANLIADVSGYQFWGRPGPAPFDHIASAIGSISRLFLEDKDPVGATFISGAHSTQIRPGLGQRQLLRILQAMLNAHPGSMAADQYEIHELELAAWKAIYRLFPQMMSDQISRPQVPLMMYGPRRRFQFATRKQASQALNWILGGTIDEGYRMAFDDELFRESCNRLFTRFPSIANSMKLVARYGAGRAEKNRTVAHLAKCLIENVSRAKDNELYVLVGDFHVSAATYGQLVNAVRVARAHFHRVMIVNVPPREMANFVEDAAARQIFQYVEDENMHDETNHYRAIQQLGATISLLDDVQLLERIAAELQILKTGGSRGPSSGQAIRV